MTLPTVDEWASLLVHGRDDAYWDEEARFDDWFEANRMWEREAAAGAENPPEGEGADDTGLLTVAQAARRLGVCGKTIRRRLSRLERAGAAWRIGRAWRIDPTKLDMIRDTPLDERLPGSEPPARRSSGQQNRRAARRSGMEWPS